MLMNVGLGKNPTSEIKIGIVLDLQTPFSQICLTSINMSLSDFYENHSNYTTRLAIHIRDSLEDAVQASAAALDLIKNEKVSAIIGPRSSLQAEFMIRLANKSQVPVITFSATSPLLTSTKTPYFVRATLNDLSQVRAIAAIVKSFEWRSVVAIYVDNEFGEGIMPYLADALQDVHTCITIRSVISLEASNDQITNQLYKLMTMQTRVFVAHMPPNLGFRVIQKARDIGMMGEGYVWIFTDGMTNWISSTEHGSSLENMQGVLGLRSRIPNSKELGNFSLRWETIFGQANAKPNVFALRAYDSITALAMAVEKADTKNLRYDNLISAFLNNTTDLGTLGVSRYGPSLLKALSDVDFNGQNTTSDEIKVGVVIDLKTNFSKICLTSINMSLSDFYQTHPHYRTRLALHVRDSMEDIVEASVAAYDLINNEKVRAIIGPRSSMQAEFMIKLATKSQVPTITFSATSPLLRTINNPYFVRATIDDSFQAEAIASIVKSFGWRSVVAIYVDNELGQGIMPSLSEVLEDVEVHRSVISPEASDDQILKELYKLKTEQTRVFVIHMEPCLGFRVLQKAREIGMMEEGYVWLLSNGMTHMMRHNGRSLETMQGLLGVRSHVPQSKEREDFSLRWKIKFQKENRAGDGTEPNVFALWAYDSVTALAMAVEKTNTKAYMRTYGPHLLEALSDVEFKGLAGDFKLINRQLESSTFEIINVIGDEERIIGLWTPSWEIPTSGKKIKVGVPVNKGFLNFVEIKTNPISNLTTVRGYAIDIFEAALKELPYSVIPQYGFEPPGDNYNDLVYQVFDGKWDAVVGDITITSNRSSYVDFTLPYTESGVSMIVPVRSNKNKNAWVFLKPWSLDLWITTGCFFVFIGFVVWLFEHRVNTDFRGPPHHQIGTSVCFSFSTMVFAHQNMEFELRRVSLVPSEEFFTPQLEQDEDEEAR
ncbi:hypothetical protein F2Q68_00027659 [Brassica cretica]|uniref:Glutamate receptor n=1 Tax=Brassica cretica TaxID=69181 RepID=A0A8S9IK94_BRACR|nr:hypothetical protein F2Q68_00027659 [Brassica cretica]